MSSCTDKKYENMIHAFELDLLKEEDRQEFEQHILKCQSCFDQVKEFLPSTRLLRHDPDFKKDGIGETEGKIVSKKKWFNFTRLLAAAALMLVVAIPIYWFGFFSTPEQEIVLLPNRTGENNVLSIQDGGTAKIVFAVENFSKDVDYDLTITNLSGDTILSEQDFSAFNEQGLGSILIPISDFTTDHYMLTIAYGIEPYSIVTVQYMFRVK